MLTVLSERTGRIVHRLRVPAGPYDLKYGAGALFLHNVKTGRLLRVSRDYTIQRLRSTRSGSTLLAITGHTIWTATRAGRVRRISYRSPSQRRRELPSRG